jgi:ankyrin repeat protein
MDVAAMLQEVMCPITLETMRDPVTLPCCGKSCERQALVDCCAQTCPLCRSAAIASLDVPSLAPNRTLTAIIQLLSGAGALPQPDAAAARAQAPCPIAPALQHQWSATTAAVAGSPDLVQLQLKLDRSNFLPKRSLFVAVVDRSGSMSGRPWGQVAAALEHIIKSARNSNGAVDVQVVAYCSCAEAFDPTNVPDQLLAAKINALWTGGGTSFKTAYPKVRHILNGKHVVKLDSRVPSAADEFGSVDIAFLTDGQDNHEKNGKISAAQLRKELQEFDQALVPIRVHAVGFSQTCDQSFLEALRCCTATPGTFRFAEPTDGPDALAEKLSSLLQFSLEGSAVPCTVQLPAGFAFARTQFGPAGGESCFNFSLPVKFDDRSGSVTAWVERRAPAVGLLSNVTVTTPLDVNVAVGVSSMRSGDPHSTRRDYVRMQLDFMATDLIALATASDDASAFSSDLRELRRSLFVKRLAAIARYVPDEPRIATLEQQAKAIAAGANVNLGKLNDLRFDSKFAPVVPQPSAQATTAYTNFVPPPPLPQAPVLPPKRVEFVERTYRLCLNPAAAGRNAVHAAITTGDLAKRSPAALSAVAACSLEVASATDARGNTALHMAAYCGQDRMLASLLDNHGKNLSINATNRDGETPLTLAIKRRGFERSMQVLLKGGAVLPSHRSTSIVQYALMHGFERTAAVVSGLGDASTDVHISMKPAMIQFRYGQIKADPTLKFEPLQYLECGLAHCLQPIVEDMIRSYGAKVDPKWLFDWAFPPKADDPETEKYLALLRSVLRLRPELIIATVEPSGDTLLHRAVEAGSLPHVRFVLGLPGVDLEWRNALGNTALWLSCAKRYPCIADELLLRGADVNAANKKGNVPMANICQFGPPKLGERLIAGGADCTHVNSNGDTLVLLSVRNGQPDVLSLLLQYVAPEFVRFKAHIDGFDALLAAVEADRPACIQVLYDNAAALWGKDKALEVRTADDNEILRGATPLHLAAYYGRTESLRLLLSLGAEVDARDADGMTALHTSAIRGHADAAAALVAAGADTSAQDSSGNRPVSYCRDNERLRAALADPLAEVLVRIARRCSITPGDAERLHRVLCDEASVPHVMPAAEMLRGRGEDGSAAVVESILYGNYPVLSALVSALGPDGVQGTADTHGLSATFWSTWLKQPRVHVLIPPQSDLPNVQRVEAAARQSSEARSLLFLTTAPKAMVDNANNGVGSPCSQSSLCVRMAAYVNHVATADARAASDALRLAPRTNPALVLSRTTEEDKARGASDDELGAVPASILDEVLWRARAFAVGTTAAKTAAATTGLTIPQRVGLHVLTSQASVSLALGAHMLALSRGDAARAPTSALSILGAHVLDAIVALPAYAGEAFLAAEDVLRGHFVPGATVSWSTFTTASTLWPAAVSGLKDFGKAGTVILFKSATCGRLIAPFSHHSQDMEVMFAPQTRFLVSAWYRGDVIALGQANIRQHTFGVNAEADFIRLRDSNKPLIIELTEQPTSP